MCNERLPDVESLQGEGGTMMIEGIKAALDFPHDQQRLRFVCFLTDGYIGNEAEILVRFASASVLRASSVLGLARR